MGNLSPPRDRDGEPIPDREFLVAIFIPHQQEHSLLPGLVHICNIIDFNSSDPSLSPSPLKFQ
jgi:hypothetical protein